MTHIDAKGKAAIPLKSVLHLAAWAAAVGLAFGAYLTWTYLQAT